MKVDTGANGNIIPLRIYQNIYPRGVSNEMGKLTTIKRETTTLCWGGVNGTKILQYGSLILKIKHQDSPTIQAKFYVCENDTAILGLRPCILRDWCKLTAV